MSKSPGPLDFFPPPPLFPVRYSLILPLALSSASDALAFIFLTPILARCPLLAWGKTESKSMVVLKPSYLLGLYGPSKFENPPPPPDFFDGLDILPRTLAPNDFALAFTGANALDAADFVVPPSSAFCPALEYPARATPFPVSFFPNPLSPFINPLPKPMIVEYNFYLYLDIKCASCAHNLLLALVRIVEQDRKGLSLPHTSWTFDHQLGDFFHQRSEPLTKSKSNGMAKLILY